MVRVDEELGRSELTVEAFDGQDDATGFEVERCLTSFVAEGGAADEKDGADRPAWLFLLESGAKTVGAGIAVEAECYSVPFRMRHFY